MREYEVVIVRHVGQVKSLRVWAENNSDAVIKALNDAPNHNFSGVEKAATYVVETVREV